jgi:two-component system, cell cycle sensor histidine kinase and response regulator CckA
MNHSLFMPHGWCMTWNPWLIGLNVVTDALVALAYYSIPAALFFIVRRRNVTLKLQPILILFGLFIALCGGGHAIDIVSIWKPIYWIKGYWNLATAGVSVLTAIVLIPRTIEFLRYPERTEQLQREAGELRQQRTLLQTVLDSVEEGIVLLDRQGRTALKNPAAAPLLRSFPQLLRWGGHKPTDQDVWRSPDGRHIERFTTEAAGFGQLYVLRDLTTRMEAEQTRLRLERVISTMKQGFSLVSIDSHRIVQTNASFDQLHGAAAESLLNLAPESVFAGLPEERQRKFREIRESCERTALWEGETRHARPDGSEFFCSSVYNLYREDGQTFLSSTHFDITEQKRIEEEAARVQSRLLQTAKMETLGLLAGGIAHDFNNLLTGILGNASLATEFVREDNPAHPFLQDAIQATERAAQLTNQLLAYSGKGRFVIEHMQVMELAKGIVGLLRLSLAPNVSLRIEDDPSLPLVEGDVTQWQQLLMNLVINAAESIGDKPGTVTLRARPVALSLEECRRLFPWTELDPGDYVCLEVQDTGCGMDQSTINQIFDPFFTTKFTGRGLGLAAVQGIVRGHRAGLSVQSAVGVGSTFSLFLPAVKPSPWKRAAGAGTPDSLAGSGTILVIDDEEMVRSTAAKALRHYGYEVIEASDGLEGVREFEAHGDRISIILLDLTMPVMSGEEALARIRAANTRVPIVLMSGYSESETIGRFSGQCVNGFLQKPFTSKTLGEKVRDAAKKAPYPADA